MTARTDTLTFSLFSPQAGATYEQLKDRAHTLERLGYDGLWLVDHFWASAAPDIDFLEAWTTLAALAEATTKLRIGVLVSCNSYRHPGLLAKMAATVDRISDGRLEVGLGAGWMEEEYAGYGYEFPPIGVRLAQLREGLEILRRMTEGNRADFQGDHYRIADVPTSPRPVQSPLPITVGGAGEKVLLELVARYADRWNCPMNSAFDIERLQAVLAEHCRSVGRDVSEIVVSEQLPVVMGVDEADYRAKREIAEMLIGGWVPIDEVAVVGTPDRVLEGLRAKAAKGVTDFALLFGDLGMDDTLELFATEVMAPLKA